MKPEILNQYIGWPFKDGGRDKNGADCLGLVIKYLNDQGYKGGAASDKGYVENFKNTVKHIKELCIKEKNPALQENDIIYFVSEKKQRIHCGVYLGYDKYLHIYQGSTSQISRLTAMTENQIKGIIRPSKEKEIILPSASGAIWFVIQVISIILAVTSVVYAFTAKPPGDLEGATPEMGSPKYKFGALRNTRSNEIPVPLIYGRCRVAGNIIYSSPLTGGTTVYQFIALSEGPVNSIYSVQANNRALVATSYISAGKMIDGYSGRDGHARIFYPEFKAYSNFELRAKNGSALTTNRSQFDYSKNYCYWDDLYEFLADWANADYGLTANYITENFPGCSYTAYLGTTTQTVDARGIADVKGLKRTAYLAITFEASEKLPNLPTVTCVVEGIKVPIYISGEWVGSTYSQNPAACIRDYLLRSKELGGAGLASGDVDDASFGAGYDYCAGSVSNGAGSTEARYELNYVIDTKRSVLDNLQDMLGTFGGFLIYKGGVLHLGIKKSLSVSHTFTMSNIKAETFSYGYISKENQLNKVGVQYVDVNQGDVKPICWVDDYEDQAKRGIVDKVFPALGIGRFSQAARMAWQILYDLKINPIYCAFQTGINALDVEAGDIIQLSHDVPAWTNKQFLITSVQESGIDEVAIEALAYNASVFNDGYGSGIMDYDYGSPPSQYDAPPDITSLSVEISKRTDISFRWTRPSPALESVIRNYEIREGATWDTAFIVAIVAANQFTYLMAITSIGTRIFHIKAVSHLGVYSVNSAQDSVAISKIPMGNVLLEFYLWAVPGIYGGRPSLIT